jgi:TPR repeat protein
MNALGGSVVALVSVLALSSLAACEAPAPAPAAPSSASSALEAPSASASATATSSASGLDPSLPDKPAARPDKLCPSREQCATECEANVASACDRLAEFYVRGWGVPRDYRKARALAKKACDLAEPLACSNLDDGSDPESKVQVARRRALLEAGCAAGRGEHCHARGQDIVFHWSALEASQRSPAERAERKRAEDLFDKGCQLGHVRSCEERYRTLPLGMSDKRDDRPYRETVRKRMQELREKACDAGDPTSCVALGDDANEPEDKPGKYRRRAWSIWAQECKAGWPDACTEAAAAAETYASAKEHRARGCELGVQLLCARGAGAGDDVDAGAGPAPSASPSAAPSATPKAK